MITIRKKNNRNDDWRDGSKRLIKPLIGSKKMQNMTKETKRKDKVIAKRKKDKQKMKTAN